MSLGQVYGPGPDDYGRRAGRAIGFSEEIVTWLRMSNAVEAVFELLVVLAGGEVSEGPDIE